MIKVFQWFQIQRPVRLHLESPCYLQLFSSCTFTPSFMMSPIPTDQTDAETVCLSLFSKGKDMAVNVGMGGMSGWLTTLVTEFIATPLPHA